MLPGFTRSSRPMRARRSPATCGTATLTPECVAAIGALFLLTCGCRAVRCPRETLRPSAGQTEGANEAPSARSPAPRRPNTVGRGAGFLFWLFVHDGAVYWARTDKDGEAVISAVFPPTYVQCELARRVHMHSPTMTSEGLIVIEEPCSVLRLRAEMAIGELLFTLPNARCLPLAPRQTASSSARKMAPMTCSGANGYRSLVMCWT